MRNAIIMIMLAAVLALSVAPVYAQDKRQENNKKIADFVLDTIKLPLLLMGAFVKRDYQKAKKEVQYHEHKGLKEALR